MKTRIGMVTVGQAPRVDVVPEMREILGPDVEVIERGALDGVSREAMIALAPGPADDILVTRLADGSSVFVGKAQITPRVKAKIADLETTEDVALTVLLCTGAFKGIAGTRPLVEPEKVLLGMVRAVSFPGRLGVLTPSARHVSQTEARWRAHGFDPIVVPMSPYEHGADAGTGEAFRTGGAGLVILDCIGFRRDARRALQEAAGVPVLVANLLVARVVAELLGA
jgi:protein AroM